MSRLFAIPPGIDQAEGLKAGLLQRLEGQGPEALARVEIWTNTSRAARRIEEVFAASDAVLLPRIRIIGSLADDPRLDLPAMPPIERLKRQFALMQLVDAMLAKSPELGPRHASFDLAESLDALVDDMAGAGIAFSALETLDAGTVAAHWATALEFLQVIRTFCEAETGAGSEARQRLAVAEMAKHWEAFPPTHPVIVAGSTGSRAATAAFMRAVLDLDQGAVILPGYDPHLDNATLSQIGPSTPDHPQAIFTAFRTEHKLPAPAPWCEIEPHSEARNALLSMALRPAPVTDRWMAEAPRLAPTLASATEGICWMTPAHEGEEALAIALALRHAAGEGKKAALVTPDATLTRRVVAALARWGIEPDESAGVPLAQTPPAVLMALILEVGPRPDTAALIAILKHPLVATGSERGAHLTLTRSLEANVLRDGPPDLDWSAVAHWAKKAGAEDWVAWWRAALDTLQIDGAAPLQAHLDGLQKAATALAAGPDDGLSAELWEKEAGTVLARVFDTLAAAGSDAMPLTQPQFRSILARQLGNERVRSDGYQPDKRVVIWGPLESRMEQADLVILGGLNETTWPRVPRPDPWLNRSLRTQIGLPSPDRDIGLSAHDFQLMMGHGQVILSRALRDGGAPTVASRWLTRLENLLTGTGDAGITALDAMQARGAIWTALAARLDRTLPRVAPEPRPCPAPPTALRPDRVSVTEVERFARDPYAIYARRILRLEPMQPLGRMPSALDRGIVLHAVMERFLSTVDVRDPDAEAKFAETAADVLNEHVPWATNARLWHGMLMRNAAGLMAGERDRAEAGTPLAFERKAKLAVQGLAQPLTLTARADRIDSDGEGRALIYDYKSTVPKPKVIKTFAPQLPLEAIMLSRGAFEGIGASPVTVAQLLGLKTIKVENVDVSHEALAETWRRFTDLMARFLLETHGYASRMAPAQTTYAGDYDHLARRGEWPDGQDIEARPVRLETS